MEEEDDLLGLLDEDDSPQIITKRPASPSASVPAKKRRRDRAGSAGSDMDMSDESSDLGAPSPPAKRLSVRAPAQKEVDFASDEDESEEEASPEMLYPYRSIYKDREDYKRLQEMNEVEREEELGARQEEVQAFKDRQKLKQLVASRDAEVEGGRGERKKTQTGRTEAKASALEKLKKTRKSKAARATGGDDEEGYDLRRRRTDYSDEDYTSEEDAPAKGRKKGREPKFVERIGQDEMRKLVLPRWRFAESWHQPWFDEFIKGAWVKVLIGSKPDGGGASVYRLAEIVGVDKERTSEPYIIPEGNQACDLWIKLRLGSKDRLFQIAHLSGEEFGANDWLALRKTLEQDAMELPTIKDYENKAAVLAKYKTHSNSEIELQQSLNTRKGIKKKFGPHRIRRAELAVVRQAAKLAEDAKTLADTEQEWKDVQQQIAQMKIAASQAAQAAASGEDSAAPSPQPTTPVKLEVKTEDRRDALAAVNERNRLANRQAIRKAELAGRVKSGSEAAALDPSARVKTTVRLLHDVSTSQNGSRAASPLPTSQPGTPLKQNGASGAGPGVRLEQQIASKVEVDLGDF